jgi:general secretion pathway protein C
MEGELRRAMPRLHLPIALALLQAATARADASLPSLRSGPPPGAHSCAFDRPELARAIRCAGDRCVVRRWLVELALDNAGPLAACARIVPSLVDGRPTGVKLYAIRPGSLMARLLLQNGDTIQRINGFEMSSPDRALEVYTRLRSPADFDVEIERRGQPMRLHYTIR